MLAVIWMHTCTFSIHLQASDRKSTRMRWSQSFVIIVYYYMYIYKGMINIKPIVF